MSASTTSDSGEQNHATFRTLWAKAANDPPLTRAQVAVELSSSFNAEPHPVLIEGVQRWRDQQLAKPHVVMFNGTKFRLHGCGGAANPDGQGSGDDRLKLRLGVTDYRSLGATNFAHDPYDPPMTFTSKAVAVSDNGNDADNDNTDGGGRVEPLLLPHMSMALGVEALLITSDDFAVLYRRSNRVIENAGWYCCPGGHAEPSAALKRQLVGVAGRGGAAPGSAAAVQALSEQFPADFEAGNVFARVIDPPNASSEDIAARVRRLHAAMADAMAPEAVLDELFSAPVDEVVEEIGLNRELLTCEGLCAVVVASNNAWKPDLVFRVRVALTATEVQQVFARGTAAEAFESEGALCFLPLAARSGDWHSALRSAAATADRGSSAPSDAAVRIVPPSQACLRLAA